MTCLNCGSRMKTKLENYRYDAVGVPGITLQGIEVSRCGKCGEFEVGIPRIEDLHRAIAEAVIAKKDRLIPEEIRFLRKHLGWTGAQFTAHFGAGAGNRVPLGEWKRADGDNGRPPATNDCREP
jgi:putative transcriptional regulator